MEEEVKSDDFGPLNVYYPNRSNAINPGGMLSDYNKDGTRRPDDEEDEDVSPVQDKPFPPFQNKSNFKRPRNNKYKKMKGIDNGYRFSISENCYILYNNRLVPDEDGTECIYINLFQCEQTKGEGRKLMNIFLHHYLKSRGIPPDQNIYVLLTAVSNVNQPKLNQYYKDIGFQQLDRFNNFKGNINDVLHFTDKDNYEKNANGFLKKTRSKTRVGSKRRPKKRRNTVKNK